MNNELLQAAKDQAAKELGYKNFGDVIMEEGELNTVINRAMEIYASQQREAGIREGFEAARKKWRHIPPLDIEPDRYPKVDDYLNSK